MMKEFHQFNTYIQNSKIDAVQVFLPLWFMGPMANKWWGPILLMSTITSVFQGWIPSQCLENISTFAGKDIITTSRYQGSTIPQVVSHHWPSTCGQRPNLIKPRHQDKRSISMRPEICETRTRSSPTWFVQLLEKHIKSGAWEERDGGKLRHFLCETVRVPRSPHHYHSWEGLEGSAHFKERKCPN